MDGDEAARLWDENAEAWTKLARAGYDVYRDAFNTPSFLDMLPDVNGQRGLDIGCGEGTNTRHVAARGATMTAIDVSRRFIGYARDVDEERAIGLGVANAMSLPFADNAFDFATAFMSLVDIPDMRAAIREAFRVIRPGGFFQFSICHPCFDTPHRKNLRDESGTTRAIEVGDYYRTMDGELFEWSFRAGEEAMRGLRPFRVARYHATLSTWLNHMIDAGFVIERTAEPCPSPETVERWPDTQDATVVAYFLHLRARKPRPAR